MSTPAGERDLELGWVTHLLAGGTTAWLDFRRDGALRAASGWSGQVPGAQNLELLRRLNLTGPLPDATAHEVLHAGLPGRGVPDLRLVGDTAPRWGHPPVDPARLPAAEVLRPLVGLLADRLTATDLADPAPVRPRRWARQFDLLGNVWARTQYLDELQRRGRTPGGAAAHAVVLITGLEELLAAQWARRAHRGPVAPWSAWLRQVATADHLPPAVDVVRQAARAADRLGARRVHLVSEPRAVARLTGVRRLPEPAPLPGAAALDLTRRVSSALVVRCSPERRHRLMWEVFRPRATALGGPPLRMPAGLQSWLTARSVDLADQLAAAGYSVHGNLSALTATVDAPHPGEGNTDRETLDLGMKMLRQLVGATPTAASGE